MLCLLLSGCSVRQYAADTVGDMLAEGGSVYERDGDIVLVGEALPFSIKLLETLLSESPRNQGLLLGVSRAYVLYAYGYVHERADRVAEDDIGAARAHRDRARRLYLRAHRYAVRALEISYPTFDAELVESPRAAATMVTGVGERDVSMLYWTAASLGPRSRAQGDRSRQPCGPLETAAAGSSRRRASQRA